MTQDFGLHPLAVEDALRAHQRPKLEVYDDSLFLVLKPVSYDDARDTVTADELMLFVGDSFVVTVRHGGTNPLAAVRQRLEEEPEVLQHGPTAVMYAVSDAVVDHYMDVAAELHVDLDELEEEVFAPAGLDTGRRREPHLRASSGRCWSSAGPTGPLGEPMARLAGAGRAVRARALAAVLP